MKYVLKNKDIDILQFESEITQKTSSEYGTDIKQYLKNIVILKDNALPLNLKIKENIEKNLLRWIKKRKAPENRQFIEKIIATYSSGGQEMPLDYINVSLGLSLNDSFWIVPADKDYKWKDYNLYDNPFDERIKHIAFGDFSQKVSGFTSSPEYTTYGMLPKCWHRENDKIYLYKGSSTEYANMGKEAYGEYYMAQIAEVMNFNHIDYDLKEFHGQIVSSCEIFTSENEGYINIISFLNDESIEYIANNEMKANRNSIIQDIIKTYGKDNFENLMLFDAIIYNTDRHCGNFGMIIDNNTNAILRPAPIFDNGLSIFNKPTKDDLKDIKLCMNQLVSYFEYDFDDQLKLFVQPRHIPNLEKLKTFEFKKHKEFNLPDSWLEPIQKALQDRANLAIEFAYQKDKKLQITKTKDIAKSKQRNNEIEI